VTEKTPAPDSERVSMMFFKSAFEYYIAGRFAVCAALGPVSGNLFHHAIEMCLKGALAAKGATLADLKKVYHHSLPRLWGEFKVRHQGPSLDEFDEVISRLHDFEDLRYPDSVLSEGMMLRIDLGKRTTTTTPAPDVSRPEPVYELYLGDVDELMGQVLDVANQNPKFYTVGFQGPAREFLVKHNSVTKLTAEG
jgi:hypothetical protein